MNESVLFARLSRPQRCPGPCDAGFVTSYLNPRKLRLDYPPNPNFKLSDHSSTHHGGPSNSNTVSIDPGPCISPESDLPSWRLFLNSLQRYLAFKPTPTIQGTSNSSKKRYQSDDQLPAKTHSTNLHMGPTPWDGLSARVVA